MWTIHVLMESGETVELPTRSVTGRHATLRDLIPLARDVAGDANVSMPWHLLEAAADGPPAPWADPIAAWASELPGQNDAGIFVTRSPVEDLVLQLEKSGMTAGHLPTAVVAPIPKGATQLGIRYEWDDNIPYLSLEHLPTLDARLYAGEKSAIFEIDALPIEWSVPREMLHDKKPWFRWFFGVTRRAGMFVGRIVHRTMVRDTPPMTHDPGYRARLDEEERTVPQTVSCPRIHNSAPSNAPMGVVVHGTFSCSVNIAARLRETCPDLSLVRFEHDTFLPIVDNVDDLVTELTRLADGGVPSFWLLSHSRGGLVACQAAALVSRSRPKVDISVWTFGTPHYGTPLAGVGGFAAQTLGAMYRLSARRNGSTFHATYVEGALSYLISTNQLPPGVAVMREGSDFLALHRRYIQDLRMLRTIGAKCNATGGSGIGHGLLLHPAVDEIFSNRDHDLVVPTESAILDKSAPIENCNHFQYFDRLRITTTPA